MSGKVRLVRASSDLAHGNFTRPTQVQPGTTTKSPEKDGGPNTGAIVGGVLVPLLVIAVIAFAIYVWYRRKYPVRMVMGKDFSRFTNPQYNKRASTLTLVRDSDAEAVDSLEQQPSRSLFSLVREDSIEAENETVTREGRAGSEQPNVPGVPQVAEEPSSGESIVRERPRKAVLVLHDEPDGPRNVRTGGSFSSLGDDEADKKAGEPAPVSDEKPQASLGESFVMLDDNFDVRESETDVVESVRTDSMRILEVDVASDIPDDESVRNEDTFEFGEVSDPSTSGASSIMADMHSGIEQMKDEQVRTFSDAMDTVSPPTANANTPARKGSNPFIDEYENVVNALDKHSLENGEVWDTSNSEPALEKDLETSKAQPATDFNQTASNDREDEKDTEETEGEGVELGVENKLGYTDTTTGASTEQVPLETQAATLDDNGINKRKESYVSDDSSGSSSFDVIPSDLAQTNVESCDKDTTYSNSENAAVDHTSSSFEQSQSEGSFVSQLFGEPTGNPIDIDTENNQSFVSVDEKHEASDSAEKKNESSAFLTLETYDERPRLNTREKRDSVPDLFKIGERNTNTLHVHVPDTPEVVVFQDTLFATARSPEEIMKTSLEQEILETYLNTDKNETEERIASDEFIEEGKMSKTFSDDDFSILSVDSSLPASMGQADTTLGSDPIFTHSSLVTDSTADDNTTIDGDQSSTFTTEDSDRRPAANDDLLKGPEPTDGFTEEQGSLLMTSEEMNSMFSTFTNTNQSPNQEDKSSKQTEKTDEMFNFDSQPSNSLASFAILDQDTQSEHLAEPSTEPTQSFEDLLGLSAEGHSSTANENQESDNKNSGSLLDFSGFDESMSSFLQNNKDSSSSLDATSTANADLDFLGSSGFSAQGQSTEASITETATAGDADVTIPPSVSAESSLNVSWEMLGTSSMPQSPVSPGGSNPFLVDTIDFSSIPEHVNENGYSIGKDIEQLQSTEPPQTLNLSWDTLDDDGSKSTEESES